MNFRGQNVLEVLDGSILGLPINGAEYKDDKLTPELSHVELKHSLLSHQNYRNHNNLMESELAIFQDLGYNIDRKAFYGYSVYRDNLVVENYQGFYARDPSRTFYLTGVPNITTFGTGLHVLLSLPACFQTIQVRY